MLKHLDFLVIGAQKSATTSLFKKLIQHPGLFIPADKEAPFFQGLDTYKEEEAQRYLETYFAGADRNALWGTVTPHYMLYPYVAPLIHEHSPNIKLIAILKHPIHRAFSHYRMSVRRGWETRTFVAAIEQQLSPEQLAVARSQPMETNTYVAAGEYGRILGEYYSLFDRHNIRVIDVRDFESSESQVMQEVFAFLGLPAIALNDLGQRHHQSGTATKIPSKYLIRLQRTWLIGALKCLVPPSRWHRCRYWFEQWNTVATNDDFTRHIGNSLHRKLQSHYLDDYRLLRNITGRTFGWEDDLGEVESLPPVPH